jgi:hypothetical protein
MVNHGSCPPTTPILGPVALNGLVAIVDRLMSKIAGEQVRAVLVSPPRN